MSKMSKRSKKLMILGGVLVAALLIYFLVNIFAPLGDEIEPGTSDEVLFLETSMDRLKEIHWEMAGESFGYAKEDGVWVDLNDAAFPVDERKFGDFLKLCMNWMAERKFDGEMTDEEMGFSTPYMVMTLDDGASHEIILGGKNVTGTAYYAKNGDGAIYMIKEDDVTQLQLEKKNIFRKEAIPSLAGLRKFEVLDEKDELIIGVEKKDDTYVRVDTGETLDTELCENYFIKVKTLAFSDYYTYKADEEDLSQYGFDEKRRTMIFTYDDAGTEKTLKLLVGYKSSDGSYRGIKYEDSKILYELSNAWYGDAVISYDDLVLEEESTSESSAN